MKTIWKVPMYCDITYASTAKGAKILCVHEQDNRPAIWFEQDFELEQLSRKFHMFGTGYSFPSGIKLNYIGTAFCGAYVWHVYEEITETA